MTNRNQIKVALTTAFCLIIQGYVFTYILRVEPNILLVLAPFLVYIAYVYARNRKTWGYDKPLNWSGAIVLVTFLDLVPYLWMSKILQ